MSRRLPVDLLIWRPNDPLSKRLFSSVMLLILYEHHAVSNDDGLVKIIWGPLL